MPLYKREQNSKSVVLKVTRILIASGTRCTSKHFSAVFFTICKTVLHSGLRLNLNDQLWKTFGNEKIKRMHFKSVNIRALIERTKRSSLEGGNLEVVGEHRRRLTKADKVCFKMKKKDFGNGYDWLNSDRMMYFIGKSKRSISEINVGIISE